MNESSVAESRTASWLVRASPNDEPATANPSLPSGPRGAPLLLTWSVLLGSMVRPVGRRFRALAVVERDEDGACVAHCPALPGAISQGDSPEEALKNLCEALAGCIDSYLQARQPIPWVRDAAAEGDFVLSRWIAVDV